MLFFNANFICYYFYPTKKREEPNKKAYRNQTDSNEKKRPAASDGTGLFYA